MWGLRPIRTTRTLAPQHLLSNLDTPRESYVRPAAK
jgi:hypothetical protein